MFDLGNGRADDLPEVAGVLAAPVPQPQPVRRYCEEELCQFDIAYEGAESIDGSSHDLDLYGAVVYPDGWDSQWTDPDVVTQAAGAISPDGTGSVVMDVPFLEGWTCVRFAAAWSTTGGDVDSRTPWSEARCFRLDGAGHVQATATIP